MKLVKMLALVLGTILAIGIYLTFQVNQSYGFLIIVSGILLAALYMLSPQVEWWWAQRHPPAPNPNMIKFLNEHFDYFRQLNGADKDKFLLRLNYFIMAREFRAMIGDDVPVPLQTMIAAEGVRTTFGLEDYLLESHERVVVYPHPFPSPDHKKLHHSETNHEDGVLVFASAPVIHQFKGIGHIFNLVLYEWISAFKHQSKASFPDFHEEDWQVFETDFGTPKRLVEASIGLPDFDRRIVGAVLYLSQKSLFREKFPAQAREFEQIFRQ